MAVILQQRVVSSLFHDTASAEHDDLIRPYDGGETVGDHEGGPSLHEYVQGSLDFALRLCIQCRCSLIKDEDRGVLDDGPRDAQSLPLASGEPYPALSHHGVIAVFLAHDEIVGIGRLGRLDDLIQGRTLGSIGNVGPDGVIEQDHLLGYHGDVFPQRCQSYLPDVSPAYKDLSGAYVEEPRQEVCHC